MCLLATKFEYKTNELLLFDKLPSVISDANMYMLFRKEKSAWNKLSCEARPLGAIVVPTYN